MTVTEKLSLLPDLPGVYRMLNAEGTVIYVGKARSLRQRVRSYFNQGGQEHAKVRAMVEHVTDFDYIITDTEREALVLESNIIKDLRPHYNIRIKDDKHYPYLRLGTDEAYPRLTIVRRVIKDGAKYFGPYPNSSAVRDMLKLMKRIFPLRQCNRDVAYGTRIGRPCLHFHIKQCLGPCQGTIKQEDYAQVVRQMEMLLDGRHEVLLKEMRRNMQLRSAAMEFEHAARLRDQVAAIEAVVEKQKIDTARVDERDVLGLANGLDESCVAVFRVRSGKVVGRESFILAGTAEQERAEILRAFLVQHYKTASMTPEEVVLPELPGDADEVESYLREVRGKKTRLLVPQRGDKKSLLELAGKNALQVLQERWSAQNGKQELLRRALDELAHYLGLTRTPERMECYDVSNIAGTLSVGSMVVFVAGQPARSDYRRFRIKWVEGANDFASLHEVLTRRLGGLREGRKAFATEPDLIIVDGGKGQLSAAVDALRQEGYSHIPVAALAKQEEIIFLPGAVDAIRLPRHSQVRYLLQRIRDEAHRFAITYHRELRSKKGVASLLEGCPGIGPARRKALLAHFGSLPSLRGASVTEVAGVKGMNQALAQALLEYLSSEA
ncbi:MAG TPA: excinuclease ABC subunit UvrC [Bacillota bacterium]|nr:excinuclease ABC subunit UvrC [Bacillota bacterium]